MRQRRQLFALAVLLALVLLPPALALADAPVTRGPESQGQGGTGTLPAGGTSSGFIVTFREHESITELLSIIVGSASHPEREPIHAHRLAFAHYP